jgi:hypothetical protein
MFEEALLVALTFLLVWLAYRVGYGCGECDALTDLNRRRLP